MLSKLGARIKVQFCHFFYVFSFGWFDDDIVFDNKGAFKNRGFSVKFIFCYFE